MEVIRFRKADSAPAHSVMTIGNFDGVHLGHQALIGQVVEEARGIEAMSVLMTFEPHPQTVLRERTITTLTSLPQRLSQFERLGLDTVCLVPFTLELAKKSAEDFVEEYLIGQFQVRRLIVGYDFAFGHNREGTSRVMEGLSERMGFSFSVFPPFTLGDEIVSSTAIRAALEGGDFALAQRLMGRSYSVTGQVERGRGRGRGLGFPTVNIRPGGPLPFSQGVFAVRVIVGERLYAGVANYGLRPTMGAGGPLLESHLFDFDEELYGESIEVIPLKRLREEKKFSSPEELKGQIARDCSRAREFLAAEAGKGEIQP